MLESPTIEDFGEVIGMTRQETDNLKLILVSVEQGDIGILHSLGIKVIFVLTHTDSIYGGHNQSTSIYLSPGITHTASGFRLQTLTYCKVIGFATRLNLLSTYFLPFCNSQEMTEQIVFAKSF